MSAATLLDRLDHDEEARQLEQIPDDPREELLIAAAGPAVTVVIAAILYLILLATGVHVDYHNAMSGSGGFVERLFFNELFIGYGLSFFGTDNALSDYR